MDKPLSNTDMVTALGSNGEPITYSQLKSYSFIEELLPNIGSFKVILIRDQPSSGHWVALVRHAENSYFYFNSYGESYNQDLYLVPAMVRKMLGNYDNTLKELLRDKKVAYNNVKFQQNSSAVCGRWVVLFVIMTTKMLYTMPEFIHFIKEKKKELDYKKYDELVLHLTSNIR
jgi:hypothetical protein